ncbi:MAG: hypothetical protein NTV21_03620 [Planctomycetota bacterium]|nr:hypothetical protein [Planctomycetota bacterium]
MSSFPFSALLFVLPSLCLHFAGIVVFQMKFQRVPLVRLLGTLGFAFLLASASSALIPQAIMAAEWQELTYLGLRLLHWAGLALILLAIGQIPLVPTLQAREHD